MSTKTNRATRAAIAAAAIASTTTAAHPLNIIMNFDPLQNEFTSVDPAAANLQTIMGFVEDYWEDHIQDSHTLTINYWYENISPLANHDLVSQSGGRETEANIQFDTALGAVERPWWFDPTPADDSEFNMAQTLWRSLSPTNATDWYSDFAVSSEVPFTFETGYAGNVPGGSPLANQWDMVTSAIHEVGHALGLSNSNTAAQSETTDGDYDFDPDFVFGATFSVETDNVNLDDNADIGHLENPNAGMAGGQAQMGRRRLPSHTDFFALASSALYTNLDVPRREFYGNSNWNNDSNWSGNKAPHANDDAYIRDALGSSTTITSRLNANGVVRNLFISEGANFDTDNFTLDASQIVTVSDLNSDVFVSAGGTLNALQVFIQNQAELEITDGNLTAEVITIDDGTQLEGVDPGTSFITINNTLINNGQIDTSGDAILVFSSLESNPWDLDGDSNTGVVDASGGNISFAFGGLTDGFDGTMRVGADRTLTIASDWTLNTGTLDLNGGPNEPDAATFNGGLVGTFNHFDGTINASGYSIIDAETIIYGGILNPTVILGTDDTLDFLRDTTIAGGTWTLGLNSVVNFEGDTTITGGTFNTPNGSPPDGRVVFQHTTDYNGGTIHVNGSARQRGNATVNNPTTINADTFDLDGIDTDNVIWTLNDKLTLNADQINASNNRFAGSMTINHTTGIIPGNLTINLPGTDRWILDAAGTLTFNGLPATFAPSLDGSELNLQGNATINDLVSWNTRAQISGTVTITNDANLRILGGSILQPYVLDGGTIAGAGTLSTIGNRALAGHGNINTPITFFNEAEIRAQDGTLNLNGTLNDVGTIGTADSSGTLNVTNPWNTNVTDLVELRGGSITGAAITNASTNTIQGNGTLAPNNLDNSGLITAQGGLLTIDPNSAVDLDGSSESGQLDATNGSITITKAPNDPFDGTATVAQNRTLTLDAGWHLAPAGTLNLNGGTPGNPAAVAGLAQFLHGTTNVDRETRLNLPTTFTPTSQTNLTDSNDILRLFANTTIAAGATFTGDGTLFAAAPTTLTIRDGVTIGVTTIAAGTVEIGTSPGTATTAAYMHNATATLHAEIFDTTTSSHDQLNVTTQATLLGTLDIDTTTLTAIPEIGDEVLLINYATRTGTFSNINGTFIAGNTDIAFAPLFDDPTGSLTLRVSIPGDLNFDNTVSVADLSIFALNFDTTPPLYNPITNTNAWQLGDFNTDGTVTTADLSLLALNFGFTLLPDGTTTPPTPLSLYDAAIIAGLDPTTLPAVPEPTTAATLLILISILTTKNP